MKTNRLIFVFLALTFTAANCNKEETDRYGEPVVKVLKNEPAHIRITCYEQSGGAGRIDTFCVVLLNKYPDFFDQTLFPDDSIPAAYRIDGLAVKISGNVTNRYHHHECIEPYFRIAPTHILEIKTIKRN